MSSHRRLLITAFEPFGPWNSNSSSLCLEALLPLLPDGWQVVARVYPVDFESTRKVLELDLSARFDWALHLGQTQQTARIRLEAVGLNVGGHPGATESHTFGLIPSAPAAYQTSLPLSDWAQRLRTAGFPASVSYHAGTYLCNATLYWGRHFIEQNGLPTQTCFVHVPLDISQVAGLPGDYLTLPAAFVAQGLARLLQMWDETDGM